jgi:tRNA dimethylallyltransferase
VTLSHEHDSERETDSPPAPDHPILSSTDTQLFSFLQTIDPISAQKLHPSDRRRVQSRVETFLRTGHPASTLYASQRTVRGEPEYDALVLWVWSARRELNVRLDSRVDKMISEGVEDESRQLWDVARETKAGTTTGVFQSIGPMS